MKATTLVAAVGLFAGGVAQAAPVYWNVFNVELESSLGAQFVTYGSLADMLLDRNRVGVFSPDGLGSSEQNIVGSGAFVSAGLVAVPAPGTLGLLVAGLLGYCATRRRRRPG